MKNCKLCGSVILTLGFGVERFWVQDVYLPMSNEYGTHTRQSRPDFGCGFEVKVPKRFQVVPISLGNISFDLGAGVHHSF